MKPKKNLILFLFVLLLLDYSAAAAVSEKFIGIKKFVKKRPPATLKKKIEGMPVNTSAAPFGSGYLGINSRESDSELTEEEKKMVKEIVEITSRKKPGNLIYRMPQAPSQVPQDMNLLRTKQPTSITQSSEKS